MMDIQTATFDPGQRTELPWWLKIQTQQPACIYYFGPFESEQAADQSRWGFIYDLLAEKAVGFTFDISQYQPVELTILLD